MTKLALDHVAFGVLDAAAFSESFARLGFARTAPSTCHWDDGSGEASAASASVVLPRQYLDFVEINDSRWLEHVESSPVYARGAAPSGIVLSGLSRDALRARGPSYQIVRTCPGATPSEIHYEFLPERDAGLPIGLIHDDAPRAMRTEAWTNHPNGATGVRRLHIRLPSSRATPDWLDVDALGIHLFETPDDSFLEEIGGLIAAGRPALLCIEFAVSDLAAARSCLERGNVEFEQVAGRLRVAPREGFGIGVQLVSDAT